MNRSTATQDGNRNAVKKKFKGRICVGSELRRQINVLDTSVPIHEPKCFQTLKRREENSRIVLPWVVIEQLDKKESELDIGRDAHEASEQIEIDQLGDKFIEIIKPTTSFGNLNPKVADYQIIATCLELKKKEKDSEVVLMSLNTNLRILARQHGLKAIEYPYTQTDATFETSFKGLSVPCNGNFYKEGELTYFHCDSSSLGTLAPNEGVICRLEGNPGSLIETDRTSLAVYKGDDCFKLIQNEREVFGLRPKTLKELMDSNGNVESNNQNLRLSKREKREKRKKQKCLEEVKTFEQIDDENRERNWHQHLALEHLLNPDIELVFLQGGAGTGKTLFALATALFQKEMQRYEQIIIVRPAVHLSGRDSYGFIPGDLKDKMAPWFAPITQAYSRLYKINPSLRKLVHKTMTASGIIHEGLDFIRGQTFDESLIIIDDAQNLSRHQIKSIITRAGFNTKMVFTGDLGQIDDRFITAKNSGLTHAMSEMKEPGFASVNFKETVRSHLASRAEELL